MNCRYCTENSITFVGSFPYCKNCESFIEQDYEFYNAYSPKETLRAIVGGLLIIGGLVLLASW